MNWQDLLLGAGGIAVSLITFWVGYRQTVGARQAKAVALDDEIIEMLLRRVVLEDYELPAEEIDNVINGKAAEARIPVGVLRRPDVVAEVLYSRILTSDLVSKADRNRSLKTIDALKKKLIEADSPGGRVDKFRVRRSRRIVVLTATMAVLAATLGILFVTVIQPSSERDPKMLVAQFATALVLIVFISAIMLRRVFWRQPTAGSSNLPTQRELATYPDEEDGREPLDELNKLSPFAIRNLFQLGMDEHTSLNRGVAIGLSAGSNALGVQELVRRRLVEAGKSPWYLDSSDGWYTLTPRGRAAVRFLTAGIIDDRAKPPEYLQKISAVIADESPAPASPAQVIGGQVVSTSNGSTVHEGAQ